MSESHSIPPESPAPVGPFADIEKLRLSQDFAASLGVKKLLTTVPVRKPGPQEFVRVHPEETHRLQTLVLDLKQDRELFIVDKGFWPELISELKPVQLTATINRQGILTLWPIRLPGEDGRMDAWSQSAHEAANRAVGRWIRVKANMGLGAYEIFEAEGELGDPQWPALDFNEILKIAFRHRFIDSADHPVLRQLRGET